MGGARTHTLIGNGLTVVFGIFAVIQFFSQSGSVNYYLAGFAFASFLISVAVYIWHEYWRQQVERERNLPPLSFTSDGIRLVFEGDGVSVGENATCWRVRKLKDNRGGTDSYRHQRILFDGNIENFRGENETTVSDPIEGPGDLKNLPIHFPPIPRDGERTLRYCWDCENSFPENEEFITGEVTRPTEHLWIEVEIPEDTQIYDTWVEPYLSGDYPDPPDPEYLNDGGDNKIKWSASADHYGQNFLPEGEYKLYWRW